ncbi:retrovirus-related pol polyprotein from transposon TNT 1-94 [Tanacetum coccineum]|uniref:Retrovirus-related pol polyprotein from transposon TNT 1-94 n=1 Tax=Tanacetum coccineum TaxID=301880 RepID=A0ABQ5IBR3_9ASTR
MLGEAMEDGTIFWDEESTAFLADAKRGVPDGQAVQTIIPNNAAFQTEDLDTYDSDCDDISNVKVVLMANISNYGSDVISEVPHFKTYLNDMENQSVHSMQDFEQPPVVDFTDNKIHSDSNIIPYSQYLQETQQANVQDTNLQAQQDSMIFSIDIKERVKTFEQRLNIDLSSRKKIIDSQMDDMIKEKLALKEQVDSLEQNLSKQIKEKKCLLQTFIVFKNESKEKENKYMENEIDLEKKIKELDNILFKLSGIKPTLYDGIVISAKHVAMPVIDDEETLILEEEGRSKILSEDFGKRFTPTQELDAVKAFLGFVSSNPTIESLIQPTIPMFLKEAVVTNQKRLGVRTKEQSDSLIDKLNLKSAENEDLKAQIQDKVFVITSLKNDLRKLKGKEIIDTAAQTPSAYTIVPGMFKLELEPLATRLLQNREAHIDYLKYTQEQADILQGIVKQAKAKQPLDKELDFSCKHAQQIQELLVESSTTSDSNTPVLSPIGLKCSTSNYRSKPTCNKNNDRISRTPSRNMKNKVEAQSRKVNKKNNVIEPIRDVDVKHSMLNANSEPICDNCKKSMFDGVHDKCLLDFVENYLDSGCSKHMTGKRSQLMNFVSKFLGTVRFRNDHIARIMGYGDYQLRNVTISRVYYVEGLGHNLFSVGQFCYADLEVAFRKNTCFIRNLKASKTKSWLWHRRLSHLNFACALGKSKKSSHQTKDEDTNQEKLYLLHMDLCSPMRVASINGKRYILVIVDDYSRFTWVRFLRSKDEALEAIIKCIKNIQVRLNATIRNVRTDNGIEFVNQTLREFYENVSISHQISVARTPQQNCIVERRNRTLVEAARTMLRFSKALLFLWAEAINTACYTQNHSLIRL